MNAICPSAIDSLVHIWTALHKNLDVEIDAGNARYLRGVVLSMDDELVARLLSAKLAMSRIPDAQNDETLARCGSDLVYSVQGRTLQATLVHGTDVSERRLGVGTRFGAALLGLRPDQSLLWPMERGRLVEVRVLTITSPSLSRQRPISPLLRMGKPCAFG